MNENKVAADEKIAIAEAVRQARDYLSLPLTTEARRRAEGHWLPWLIQAIDAEKANARRLFEMLDYMLHDDEPSEGSPVARVAARMLLEELRASYGGTT